MQLEMVSRDDAEESGTRSARRPEIFCMLVLARRDEFSLRRHELDGLDAFRARPPDALVPCHAAAEQIAAQLDLRAVAAGIGEPVGVENLLNVPLADDRLHDGLADLPIDRDDLIQYAQVDEQAPLQHHGL